MQIYKNIFLQFYLKFFYFLVMFIFLIFLLFFYKYDDRKFYKKNFKIYKILA